MKLDVSKALMNPGQEYLFSVEQTIAPQDVSGDIVTLDDALLKGTYMAGEDGSVTMEGVLTTVAHSVCANCLEPASAAIETEFRETFLHDGDPEDDEIFSYSGSKIDFEKLAMSYAVMALPIRFLCREDCSGMAGFPVAGDESLYSEETTKEHPFAALKDLFAEDEEV